jgi:hypothetical protein
MRLVNCLIASNSASDRAGGIYAAASSLVSLNNCTLADNSPHGLYGVSGSSVYVTNSILWNNGSDATGAVTLAYCDVGVASGAGVTTNDCLSTDPLFVDTTYYHLKSKVGNYVGGYFSGGTWGASLTNSPCIDVGDTNSSYALEPAPNGRRVNMGAYGNTAVASLSSSSSGTVFKFR